MCFSAESSFTASALLTFVGTVTLRKVHKPSQTVFASIPIFFAFQQFTEGVLWLVIGHPGYSGMQTVSTYIFLVMAQVIWPIMIPLSVLLMEENKTSKRILIALLTVGAAIGLWYLYNLIFYDVHPGISGGHIVYQGVTRDFIEIVRVFVYLIATLTPFFVSSVKKTNILGIIMLLSFLVSVIFYRQYLTFVWCYFAAVISLMIFFIIGDSYKKFHFDRIRK